MQQIKTKAEKAKELFSIIRAFLERNRFTALSESVLQQGYGIAVRLELGRVQMFLVHEDYLGFPDTLTGQLQVIEKQGVSNLFETGDEHLASWKNPL